MKVAVQLFVGRGKEQNEKTGSKRVLLISC